MHTINRKQEILDAALQEFIRKGAAGARMQSIADKVGVTKAMIHYYFDTKEKLFSEAFGKACSILFRNLTDILETEVPLFQKIEQFIIQSHERFHSRPALAEFIVTELNRNPKKTKTMLLERLDFDRSFFEEQLKTAASNYEIAQVDSNQLLANIFSLCMFPYTGRTFIKELLDIGDDGEYREFLEKRGGIVTDTIINWLAS